MIRSGIDPTRRPARGASWALGLVLLLSGSPGRAEPPQDSPRQQEQPQATPPDRATREAWDAVFIAGRKVGHIHLQVEPVTAGDGRELLRIQVDSKLTLKRLDDQVVIATRYGTIETYDGQVLRLDARSLAGPNETRVSGDVQNGVMPLTLTAGGRQTRVELPWPDDVRGPYGPELSLARSPMQPGDRREIKTFIPDLNQIGLTTLTARQVEPVELGGGSTVDLLRVEGQVKGPDGAPLPGMDASYWVDTGGQILKSRTDAFGGIVTYRTTREGALAPGGGGFDIVQATIVKVGRRITQSGNVRSATYRVNLTGDTPAETVFPGDERQSVRRAGDGSVLLDVRTAEPQAGAADPSPVPPEYLAANPMINSEDSQVVSLARRALADVGPDPWERAQAITRWVADNVREKNFETAFATARDVARDLSGDCSEHSVLTAAMCRASGIPARVAVGLLYVDELGGFGFHMWNEVHVNGRWVAVDAALRQTEVDATHLKLNATSLDGVSPYAQFLDVVRVFDKLTLDPLQVQ
ncbi:transglutaminase-like domain-containing protein [Tautonia sp. JC769]|uniref:transglutaminase-like domain-containing protein n=1 Tax=Tautonia sp. JC769 TaxID=3232135 RepID=UPI0034587F28